MDGDRFADGIVLIQPRDPGVLVKCREIVGKTDSVANAWNSVNDVAVSDLWSVGILHAGLVKAQLETGSTDDSVCARPMNAGSPVMKRWPLAWPAALRGAKSCLRW